MNVPECTDFFFFFFFFLCAINIILLFRYTMVGSNPTRICNDGTWSSATLPLCKADCTSNPTTVANANFSPSPSYNHGNTAVYVCNSGCVLVTISFMLKRVLLPMSIVGFLLLLLLFFCFFFFWFFFVV